MILNLGPLTNLKEIIASLLSDSAGGLGFSTLASTCHAFPDRPRGFFTATGGLEILPSIHKERVFSHGDSLSPFAEQRKVACNSPITSLEGVGRWTLVQAFKKLK